MNNTISIPKHRIVLLDELQELQFKRNLKKEPCGDEIKYNVSFLF
jgi:hypothetical protein